MRPEHIAVIEAALGGNASVRNAVRLSAGASRQTWRIEVESDGSHRILICQRERPGGARAGTGLSGEAALLEAMGDAGVPVASVVAADRRNEGVEDPLGSWIVLDCVDGETIPRRILDAHPDESRRSDLLGQLAASLAIIHSVDVDPRYGLESMDQLGFYRSVLDALGDPRPTFELAFRWLATNRPADSERDIEGRRRIVHGDFRLGNVIVADGRLEAVLDWELAHVGDPVEDLAWCSLRAWRFSSPLSVAGLGTVEQFTDAYCAAGGEPVDALRFRWWQVLGTLKWGIMCIVQASAHHSGASRSVELAAIGRRVAETEEDLLDLIAGPHPYTSELEVSVATAPWGGLGGPGGPGVRPSAAELLEAVGEFLESVRDESAGRTRYMARVSANVVDQLGRELRLGPAIVERHRARLASLGCSDDVELAAAIADGRFDIGDERVLGALRESVRDTLAVVHPGYADPSSGGGV
ncbi:MAG: phosphotransferase family protein [Actinobacteria bacterium]|nr:phosphotransferase family protein [Actinomycetota bacterium]